jgi:ABC-2 type transport system permease protein
VSAHATLATARRLLAQLRHDRRTLALLALVPVVLLGLLKLIFADADETFQRIGPPLLGIFPLEIMFLVTSVTMLRERTSGTLERLMTLPLSRGDLVAGYALAFAVVAAVQALIASAFALTVLGLEVQGSTAALLVVAVLNAELGMAMGLGLSSYATTEFQTVQFMPAFLLPQFLLCGLLVPRDTMSDALYAVSEILPLTYAYDALAAIAVGDSAAAAGDAAITLGFCLLALALGALTLRRRTG